MTEHRLADPIDFALDALAALPDDPAAVTEEDLSTLAAASEGAARQALDLRARAQHLAAAVLAGPVPGAAERSAALTREHERAMRADALLDNYARAAFAARGLDPERLLGPQEAAPHDS